MSNKMFALFCKCTLQILFLQCTEFSTSVMIVQMCAPYGIAGNKFCLFLKACLKMFSLFSAACLTGNTMMSCIIFLFFLIICNTQWILTGTLTILKKQGHTNSEGRHCWQCVPVLTSSGTSQMGLQWARPESSVHYVRAVYAIPYGSGHSRHAMPHILLPTQKGHHALILLTQFLCP